MTPSAASMILSVSTAGERATVVSTPLRFPAGYSTMACRGHSSWVGMPRGRTLRVTRALLAIG